MECLAWCGPIDDRVKTNLWKLLAVVWSEKMKDQSTKINQPSTCLIHLYYVVLFVRWIFCCLLVVFPPLDTIGIFWIQCSRTQPQRTVTWFIGLYLNDVLDTPWTVVRYNYRNVCVVNRCHSPWHQTEGSCFDTKDTWCCSFVTCQISHKDCCVWQKLVASWTSTLIDGSHLSCHNQNVVKQWAISPRSLLIMVFVVCAFAVLLKRVRVAIDQKSTQK